MEPVDNNQFEIKLSKRKIQTGPNVYLNPALDILANEDPMCNNGMEITPNKRRKRTRSLDLNGVENTGLDIGITKAAINEFLAKELENVHRNVRNYENPVPSVSDNLTNSTETISTKLTDFHSTTVSEESKLHTENVMGESSETKEKCFNMDSGISIIQQNSINAATSMSVLENNDLSAINNASNIQTSVTKQRFLNNSTHLNLSFIDRLALDSPIGSNRSLYLDDDLNESNIMEIKTITIITKKKIINNKKSTNPFLDPNLKIDEIDTSDNPFIDHNVINPDSLYNPETKAIDNVEHIDNILPRRLFTGDTNSTISTVNESSLNNEVHEYENIDSYRSESPIYENIHENITDTNYNKQSKILGCDVSLFNATDINNLKKNTSNESYDSKRDLKHQLLKVSNKLSKKVFKTLKKKFKGEKSEPNGTLNYTLNPYEVPRKASKQKVEKKDTGIENPALYLDNSDEIDIEEELDEEHQYETIKTMRNTHLNTNVTPLKERDIDNIDLSQNRTFTPGKKVRFDSTLNKEKVITGNSFDYDIQSPGFDAKIDKYQDELENCINERKFIQQNM